MFKGVKFFSMPEDDIEGPVKSMGRHKNKLLKGVCLKATYKRMVTYIELKIILLINQMK